MIVLAAAALLLAAPQQIPRLSSPAEDLAGVLTPAQRQVALLLVKSTAGKDIFDYSLETARANRIGQGGKSNGALIVVAVDDRKVWIQVGQGLEGKLPDAITSRIIRDEMVPRFKAGDYG